MKKKTKNLIKVSREERKSLFVGLFFIYTYIYEGKRHENKGVVK